MYRISTLSILFSCLLQRIVGQELQNEFPTKCLEGLGCYETGYPFYELPYRFLSLLPFDKESIDTKFLLFTPLNPTEAEITSMNNNSVKSSYFNPALPIKVIIPGFESNIDEKDWTHLAKNAILQCSLSNILIVDWSSSNKAPYPQALANARVVATQLAKLINYFIYREGSHSESVHIIGHSLGAHLAGWAGSQIQNLGRITGLDPAGPFFYEAPAEVRLDDTDALFVDVIHTNGGKTFEEGIGLEEPIGHLDFYPNGGQKQPGCYMPVQQQLLDESTDDFDPRENNCSHARAVSLFIESIVNKQCRFIGLACETYADFMAGKCNRRGRKYPISSAATAEMGIHSKKCSRETRGQKFYLQTNEQPPHCLHRY